MESGVTRNLHHIAIEHGIVFPQKVSFVQAVADDSDKTALGVNHTA
jgi:hypothetical protein